MIPFRLRTTWQKRLLSVCLSGCTGLSVLAQSTGATLTEFPLTDLSAFKAPSGNWKIAGDAIVDRNATNAMKTASGKGVLANIPDDKNKSDVFTTLEHGNLDLDLDFMMAKGSNSGIYLQGRYEVQLLDSWGVKNPSIQDCGAIYQRWDNNKPEAEKGYEGYAPRVNASRAPGLWQNLKISFQAPRFDANGQKIANARIIKMVLNGVTIHENVELTGPTRGSAFNTESPTGPLRIQGDHGSVAFRNIRYRSYSDETGTSSTAKGQFVNDGGSRYVVNPILLSVEGEPTIMRCFIDFRKEGQNRSKRITHAANVGDPAGVHYTYDLNTGALVQVWKGEFLNATPMWHSRGDGSARPLGSVVKLSDAPAITVLADKNAAWPDTIGSNAAYRFKGYDLDNSGRPTFMYTTYGVETQDQLRPEEDGKILTREIKLKGGQASALYIRIAEGNDVVQLSDGTYSINNKEYLVKVGEGAKPVIRNSSNGKELVVPVSGLDKGTSVKYSIIW
jgi:hypothetical protein